MRRIILLLLVPWAITPLFFCDGAKRQVTQEKPVVVLLALDGADWALIDPLIAQGKLPLFKELKQTGAWGALRTATPAKSPVIWTTIATGKVPGKHGVEDFRATRINSRGKHPLSSSLDIREPMLWEMLESQGRRSVLVNWYLSFPPQPLRGVNVSDYFAFSALGGGNLGGGALDRTVFPGGIAEKIARGLDRDYLRVLRRMNLPDYPALYEKQHPGGRFTDFPVFKEWPGFVLEEGVVIDVAHRLVRSEEFDLFAVYLELADKVQHFAYMSFVDADFQQTLLRESRDGRVPEALEAEAYRRIADILCPVYQNLERILRSYLECEKYRHATFFIVSDHGFSLIVRENAVIYNHIGQDKAPDGILIVRGPQVKPGKILRATIRDIAPSILYVLGLPQDLGADGHPLRRVFSMRGNNRSITYHKRDLRKQGDNHPVDEKKLQELRALGYIN